MHVCLQANCCPDLCLRGAEGCQGMAAQCPESFPALPSARTEQNTLCVNRNKPTFPAKVLHSSLFAKWLHYLLWLRVREMLLFKGENKWRCFPPHPSCHHKFRHLWSTVPYKQMKELLWSLLIRGTLHHSTSHQYLLLLLLCMQQYANA